MTLFTRDGRKLSFEVAHVDAVAVEGEGERVPLADIVHVEVGKVDGAKTAAAVVQGSGPHVRQLRATCNPG